MPKVVLSALAVTLFLAGGSVWLAYAQAPIDTATPYVFEVASIKQNVAGAPARGRIEPGRFTAAGTPVMRLLLTAFDVTEDRIVNAPGWVRADQYDVTAKPPDGLPLGPNLAPLMRALLRDRFGLRVHVETRELPTYDLVIARSDRKLGPKIQQATCDCSGPATRTEAVCHQGPPLPAIPEMDGVACALLGANGVRVMRGYPLTSFAKMMTGPLGRVVVDMTGLTGTWNLQLEYRDEPPSGDAAALERPSLVTAIQEQLGLRVQPSRRPVEVVVVDRVERPAPD